MFGTLHWNSRTKEAEFVERPHGSAYPEKNFVCDRCRAKKVKCSNNYNGCTRCERLRKTCTFSSIKNRGEQRSQKGTNRFSQRERSLDLSIPSSASSGSKDTGNEELPADNKADDSKQGQQLLAEPPTERMDGITPTFDLSFVDDFGQQTGDHDGDNMFSVSLSPWPFFTTKLPSTPTPVPRTSAALLSPSSSPGDETMPQSQDWPLFEIISEATPISLDASTLVPTLVLPQDLPGQSCQCLAAVVFAVEEFEATCNSGSRAELDSIIAYQKEAIRCCRSMLKCGSCMTKRENIVLLVFISKNIVAACGQIVVLYRMKDANIGLTSSTSSTSVSSTTSSSPSTKADCTQLDLMMSARSGSSSHWQELLVGDYEINSSLEWEHVVRVLISLQLRAAMDLLADVKNMGNKVLGETQTASLAQAERRVSELEKDVYVM